MDVKRFEPDLFDTAADDACDLVKALAHPARLRIVCALSGRECSVTGLAEIAEVPISTISRHLALLRKDHIVKTRRARQTVFYSLSNENVGKFVATLAETFCDLGPARSA
ncbi:metalloregulator ArsR/SmtB family transcription factor [Rhodoblastus sp.]|jgi:DNA-binding transcriptional ArsR family regulator|uniref:ArsR/SmtB family transcription factor n=1 Tax=Rhodoblastus sp. TaxID=1962975 RepID=UPI0026109205|nr:metalloregulator ArsR/SmtB family transcription factor [Rhodoblastus sp.]